MEIQSEKDKMDWRRMTDNRDMNAYACWDPPERYTIFDLALCFV